MMSSLSNYIRLALQSSFLMCNGYHCVNIYVNTRGNFFDIGMTSSTKIRKVNDEATKPGSFTRNDTSGDETISSRHVNRI